MKFINEQSSIDAGLKALFSKLSEEEKVLVTSAIIKKAERSEIMTRESIMQGLSKKLIFDTDFVDIFRFLKSLCEGIKEETIFDGKPLNLQPFVETIKQLEEAADLPSVNESFLVKINRVEVENDTQRLHT